MGIRKKLTNKLVSILLSGWSDGTIEEQRTRQERMTRFIKIPTDIQCQPVNADGVPAEWIFAPDANSGVILYLHGGAYSLGSISNHREFIARLARITRTRGLAINYRLAPEHPFPAALDDATSSYRWLLKQGVDPSQTILAGDSAGGGLAISTAISLLDAGDKNPAGIVCISPWTDLSLSGASIQNNSGVDPILDQKSLKMYADFYTGTHESSFPLISPLNAILDGLPPLLIQVGSDEILLDDAIRLHEKALSSGVDAVLDVYDKMFHVFQLFSFLPESKKSVRQIAKFVIQRLYSENFSIGDSE